MLSNQLLFLRHAKRSTVSVEDVKLSSRRNPSLLKILTNQAEKLKECRLEQQKAGKELKAGGKGGAEDSSPKEEEDAEKIAAVKDRTRNRIIDSD